jgi:serine protease AprX
MPAHTFDGRHGHHHRRDRPPTRQLTKAQANKLASGMAHDGLARSINPVHTAGRRRRAVCRAPRPPAFAAPGDGNGPGQKHRKMARDLDDVETAAPQQGRRWMRERGGRRMVQVVIVSADADRNMTALKRRGGQRVGGSVDAAMPGLSHADRIPAGTAGWHASASVPTCSYVAPNRETRRTASTLEPSPARRPAPCAANSTKTSYSGLDGTGVGIAIVDSGVMRMHEAFNNAAGVSRVARSVQFMTTNAGRLDQRLQHQHVAAAGQHRAGRLRGCDQQQREPRAGRLRPRHARGVDRRRPRAASTPSPDLTGIAPGASIYDVKVLNDSGCRHAERRARRHPVGDLPRQGIQHPRDEPEPGGAVDRELADRPAVRRRTQCRPRRASPWWWRPATSARTRHRQARLRRHQLAGQRPDGHHRGRGNFKGTVGARRRRGQQLQLARADPRRLVNGCGVRVPDNLLKPDLVAPGNRIFGAAATGLAWNAGLEHSLASLQPGPGHAPPARQTTCETLMMMSGTSIAAPAVAGTAALLLQANPGLTPPLVKAILQYTAQPLPAPTCCSRAPAC